ncbi:MAG TPA: hypothetical protein RMH99_32475 [Sandaracinaceae bacterium LLY-WYZ-13_1]|nr:hypothetical protein [Sandaracinaceae bacterium LLY-WYZ-13_1]
MTTPPEEPAEVRRSPLVGQVALLVGFVLIVVAAVFTVVVPELSDDAGEDTVNEAAPAEPPEDAPASDDAPAAP